MNVLHRSMHSLVCTLGAMAAVLLGGAVSTAFAAATLTPLGHLPGHPVSSYAYGVSGDGSVVVGGSGFPVETIEAFRWTSGGGMVGLGYLPGSEFNLSYAHGVSGDGSVVVGRSHSASGTQAFRWTGAGGMVGLGILPGDLYSDANGISGDGSVVVGTSYSDSVRQEAFRWTASGGMQGLGDLPGGPFGSAASGVSADGSVIVGSSTVSDSNNSEAFRWTSGGGMVGLGYLPGAGEPLPGAGPYGWASGVSADGSVIVGGSSSASASFGEAFRWTSDAGMVGLGIPPGAFSSSASGVNGDGSVVVGSLSWYPSSGAGTFYWTADGGMRTLWDVLLSHGVDPAADGWTDLYSVDGISADGNTIVGFGDRNGQPEAFVAVIPISSPLPGDFNGDNVVDAADYVVWRDGLGGAYDETHYTEWQQNFGATAVGAAAVADSAAVPEPAAGALALLGVSSILLLRRRSPGRPNKFSLSKVAAMLASYRRPPERSNPMRQLKLFRWAAALTLAIALAPGAASAQEAGTITISSTFNMDWLVGTVGPDLAEVFANGHEHTWTLTLYGTSQSHETFTNPFEVTSHATTEIHATSFDLEFSGPDAATLNGIVSDHIAGGDVFIYLENSYTAFGDFAIMYVWPMGPDMEFFAGHDMGVFTLFPSDADGYPVVGPDPFSIWAEYSVLSDIRPGNNGAIQSRESLVTFEGSMGELDPGEPVVLAVADASVLEGNRGTSKVAVAVTLSNGSSQAITVSYRTVDGTAKAKADYAATSGTLTFQPGETSRTISVAIKGDRKREANETFSVQLSNAVGATIDDGVATVTILNDD